MFGLEETTNSRIAGVDAVKTLAVLFVISVHFFLNTQYYNGATVTNLNMYFQTLIRWIFVTCVPLFLLATGYLNGHKTPNKRYFLNLTRVLVPYVLISILCIIRQEVLRPGPIAWKSDIFSIFNFTANAYAWYVNMFIGLYLIAPFLNSLLRGLDKKKLHLLLIILLVVVSLPLTFNPIFALNAKFSFIFFPDYWVIGYPLIYYILGVYIARFRPKVNKRACLVVIAALAVLQTGILVLVQRFLVTNWLLTDFGTIFIVPMSICIFLVVYDINIKATLGKRTLKLISSITLEMYLLSFLADQMLYPFFYSLNSSITQEAFFKKYFLIIVPSVFILTFVSAVLLRISYLSAGKGLKKLISKHKKTPTYSTRDT